MKVKDFNLEQTFECGQCFNFEKINTNTGNADSANNISEYAATARGRLLHVRQCGDEVEFLGASAEDIKNIWIPYFDLNRDYGKIKREIAKTDVRLEPIIERYGGIRILNQEFAETLLSFIISQNKNIPQIKKTVRRISEEYGEEIGNIGGRKYYSFPTCDILSRLSEEDFRALGTGFRAPYLKAAVDFLTDGHENAELTLRNLSYPEAKRLLMSIKGVGDKVANCVLLFSLGFRNAFPVDVWIERIMREMYFTSIRPGNSRAKIKEHRISRRDIEVFASEKFGKFGGYAQQYLFIYAKENGVFIPHLHK